MRVTAFILTTLVLIAACSERASLPTPPTVEALAADPDRLKDTMKRCKADRAAVGDATCNAASEAFRKRFMGSGKPNYTPQPVDLFPQTPDKTTSQPSSKPKT